MFKSVKVGALLAFTSLSVGVSPAFAEVDFSGKSISLYTSSGGFLLYARLIGPHLSDRLPGNPDIIVQSMPGAGSLVLASYLYEAAATDGTEIGIVSGSIATSELFQVPDMRIDPREFSWIGSISSDVGLVVANAESGFDSIEEVFDREMIIGGAGAASGNVIFPTVLNNLLGTRFNIVRGYSGQDEIAVAIERGEVDGVGSWNYSSLSSMRPAELADGSLRMLLQLSLVGHPEVGDVPLVTDLARNDEELAALNLVFATQRMARPLVAPPGTDPEILATFRRVFNEILADPAFHEDAHNIRLTADDPMTGEEIEALIAELYETPPDVVSLVNQLMIVE